MSRIWARCRSAFRLQAVAGRLTAAALDAVAEAIRPGLTPLQLNAIADEVIRDDSGDIAELHCSYDPQTLGVNPPDRKIRGVIHWVSAEYGVSAEVRLYDRLFNHPMPDADREVEHWKEHINPESLVVREAFVEPMLAAAEPGERFHFEREGYFCRDPEVSDRLVFNRVVTLRDSWAKIEQGNKG